MLGDFSVPGRNLVEHAGQNVLESWNPTVMLCYVQYFFDGSICSIAFPNFEHC